MNKTMKNAEFGRRDSGEHAVSFAQMLLSGKPLARPASAMELSVPYMKAKRKAQFGRNNDVPFEGASNGQADQSSHGTPPWWQIWRR
ncbi:hypothetical protein [Magnetovibrio blakemorei]|uniref:Uncharacterized protein n=1 Tax=Magnetovibrio blakemorei TaxID=28181 RepID=A0A1E5Q868_9PROT|nr:hypothetical protein [Magnetovibrio blakemorei]OEJ67573.1 hypothetical protein BEN30_09080 [Magnetovibrio blakemorei]